MPSSNCVYVADEEDGIVVLDAATCARVARIEIRDPSFFAYDSRDDKVYLSADDTVAVVDPSTHQVTSRLEVGRYPSVLTYNASVNKLYCRTGPDGDSLTVVDCSTDSVIARIRVGRCDYEFLSMSCVPAGNKVYVASFEDDEVAVVDGVGDSLIRTLYIGDYPAALVYSPAGNKLYCADMEDEEISVFDAGPDTLLRLIEMGGEPFALGYSPLSNKVYGAILDSGVAIIDCAVDTVTAWLGIDIAAPTSFLFDSVDNRLFCFDSYYHSVPSISCSGDTLVGSVNLNGDAHESDGACYDPQQNRLYARGRSSDDVMVVNAATCEIMTAVQMNPTPNLGCYAGSEDKFYCADEESGVITVIDCSADSVQRRIATPGWDLGAPVYSSDFNKLYYEAYMTNSSAILVVDCARDSLLAALPLNVNGDASAITVYNPTVGRIYCLAESTVVAIDCAGDSIVARVPVGFLPCALACNPDSNRVYFASYRAESLFISAIDCTADTVLGSVLVHLGFYWGPQCMTYVPSRDVVVSTVPDTALVVVDGKARQLLQTIPLGGDVSQFRLDRAADKLYCLLQGSDELAAIDCRDMNLQARVRLAARLSDVAFDSVANRLWVTSPDFGCISLVDGRTNHFLGFLEAGQSPGDITWVPRHRKMYAVDQRGQAILVLRDTSLAGIADMLVLSGKQAMPTVVRGMLFLPEAASPKPQAASLLDVSGRKVLDLRPGANDVRALAPGVYFVREEPQAASHKPQAVRKVVITR